jgi:hypothetical protein
MPSSIVFVVEDRSGVFEIEFVRLCREVNRRLDFRPMQRKPLSPAASFPPFRKERERMGHPAGSAMEFAPVFAHPCGLLVQRELASMLPDLSLKARLAN